MAVVMNMLLKPGALRTLEEARAILENVTPLKKNCGRLCDAACCQSDESGENGMLLFPYEECFYEKPIEGFPFHLAEDDTLFKGGKRLVCEGVCPREHRPLACRPPQHIHSVVLNRPLPRVVLVTRCCSSYS